VAESLEEHGRLLWVGQWENLHCVELETRLAVWATTELVHIGLQKHLVGLKKEFYQSMESRVLTLK
jgi:hypothetical protein